MYTVALGKEHEREHTRDARGDSRFGEGDDDDEKWVNRAGVITTRVIQTRAAARRKD